mmetsp:Transcript_29964/g.82603  ORF Transcript_29964/g.82603 Transcript_29964/m.82603 type:complete len:104 (-) Transcript_29964:32-343(-)
MILAGLILVRASTSGVDEAIDLQLCAVRRLACIACLLPASSAIHGSTSVRWLEFYECLILEVDGASDFQSCATEDGLICMAASCCCLQQCEMCVRSNLRHSPH